MCHRKNKFWFYPCITRTPSLCQKFDEKKRVIIRELRYHFAFAQRCFRYTVHVWDPDCQDNLLDHRMNTMYTTTKLRHATPPSGVSRTFRHLSSARRAPSQHRGPEPARTHAAWGSPRSETRQSYSLFIWQFSELLKFFQRYLLESKKSVYTM